MPSTGKKYTFLTRAILFFSLVITGAPVIAQALQKRGEKYKEAYKKYLGATCPIAKDSIQHFVYFARDRELIAGHPLLTHPMFKGAQVMYSWRQLELQKNQYDFSIIKEDCDYLKKFSKEIFIQLQDATFSPAYKGIPDYLFTDEYDGGAAIQYNDDQKPGGWVAKRWNKKIRERFALLLQALGKEFDGKIAGINLQETAIGVNPKTDTGFSEQGYVNGLKENMLALKKAFPSSTTMIYANFVPGEWLPGDDKGYLRSIYRYAEAIGVGAGAPDLMVTRKGQLNHAYTLMHEHQYTVPLGIAVQDGNYTGQTGADLEYNETAGKAEKTPHNIVPLLYGFAKDFLKVKYMFWVDQVPYFKEQVLPCFSGK